MSYLCYHQSEGLNRTFYGIETSAPLQLTSMAYFRLNRAQGGLSVAGRCRCLTKDSNTSIEKEGYIPYSLQA